MPKPASTRPAYKMLTCIYLCRTLLFFAPYADFSFKKAWRCIVEATIFFALVSCIYFIGEHKGNPEGALQCVSFITYSVFYFYGVNILRNIKEILPNSSNGYKVVAFLHYVLSVEFIKNIPYLTNYLQKGDAK